MSKDKVQLVDKKDLELFAKKIQGLEDALEDTKEAFKILSGVVKTERKKRTPKVQAEAAATEATTDVEAPAAEVSTPPVATATAKAPAKAPATPKAATKLVVAKAPPAAAKANGKGGMPTLPGKH